MAAGPPAVRRGAAVIGVTARSRRAIQACRGAGDSDAVGLRGCQNPLCREGPSLVRLLGDCPPSTSNLN